MDEITKWIEKQQVQCTEVVALVKDLKKEIQRLNSVIDALQDTVAKTHNETVGSTVTQGNPSAR